MLNLTQIKKLLYTELVVYEKERSRFHKRIMLQDHWLLFTSLTSVLVIGIFIWSSFNKQVYTSIIFIILVVVICKEFLFPYWDGLGTSHESKEDFDKKMKRAVFEKILKHWNSSTSYTSNRFLNKDLAAKTFLKRQLQRPEIHYTGMDHCQGLLADGRAFCFSKIVLKEKEVNKSGSTTANIHPNFEGLFLVVKNSSPFMGFDGRLSNFSKNGSPPSKENQAFSSIITASKK